jgi:hypothetical protein
MPTELPPHPNLQHLKKQAKALLHDFHERKPDATEKFTALRLNVPPKLSDAQHLVARDYGFDSWSEMKERVESLAEKTNDALELAKKAFREDDAATVHRLLKRYPQLRALINEPMADFGSQPITHVRSRAMLDVLLKAGADINAKSRWWAGGFGLLDFANPELAAYAIKRGAKLTVHAAAATRHARRTQTTTHGKSRTSSRQRRRWTHSAPLCIYRWDRGVPARLRCGH